MAHCNLAAALLNQLILELKNKLTSGLFNSSLFFFEYIDDDIQEQLKFPHHRRHKM